MLETFRKHHYVLMCLIAVAVIISFTFFFNPNSNPGGRRTGSAERVGTVYGRDFTLGEVEIIEGQRRVAAELAKLAQDRSGEDPVAQFGQVISELVNTAVTDRNHPDVDYPTNILVMRQECENLGIEVEREDIEKFIKRLGAFQTGGKFDAKKLEAFRTGGAHGDIAATETKLFAVVRDVMLFQRLSETVGGSFAPSQAETDADYAQSNQLITAATVLIDKKAHETQAVTDEEIQKFYDAEKAKTEAVAKPDDKTSPGPADPIVLSDEQRTVKYVVTEAPQPPAPPVKPSEPPAPLPVGDLSTLPEDQRKAKEEEHKKRQEEYTVQQGAYTKSMSEYNEAVKEHSKKVEESKQAKTVWLKKVETLCNAIVADDRGGKSFEELAQIVAPPAPAAPAEPPPPTDPAPKPAEDPAKPATDGAKPAEDPAKPAEDPAKPAEDPAKPAADGTKPAADCAPPTEDPANPAADGAKPAEDPAKPAADGTAPAEDPARPAENPAKPVEENGAAADPASPDPAKPVPFGVKTATFTTAAPPEEIKKITASEGDAAKIIFSADPNDTEMWIESQGQGAYCFFVVTDIKPAALLPLDQVKQKISDKLKTEKVNAAMRLAADSARSNILDEIKAGKSFKDAAMEKAMLTATELPPFSKKTPLPPTSANARLVTSTITGDADMGGMGAPAQAGLQAGEISSPLEVPNGLLLVYVEKKELPKHPEMEQQKKALVESHTYHAAAAKMPDFQGPGGFEAYMGAMQYFRGGYGTMTNPVLKAWFAARRADAQAIQ